MLVSLEGLPGKVYGSARFEDEKDEARRMLERTGTATDWKERTSFVNDTPEYYFLAADHWQCCTFV
jgi:hypothetical protein